MRIKKFIAVDTDAGETLINADNVVAICQKGDGKYAITTTDGRELFANDKFEDIAEMFAWGGLIGG